MWGLVDDTQENECSRANIAALAAAFFPHEALASRLPSRLHMLELGRRETLDNDHCLVVSRVDCLGLLGASADGRGLPVPRSFAAFFARQV